MRSLFRNPLPFFSFVFLLVSCADLSLKKLDRRERVRLGVVGFKITAPINKLKDIDSDPGKKDLQVVIAQREREAKEFFIRYTKAYYKDTEIVAVPAERVHFNQENKIPKEELIEIQKEFNVDALVYGEIPWYGKTNPFWPTVGLTVDIASESVALGILTKWNWTIILANVGLELVTNTPLWFGGAYLFGQSFKPVTIDVTLVDLLQNGEEYSKEFEVVRSSHLLKKFPKKDRGLVENQLEASLKKALKEIAIDLNEK